MKANTIPRITLIGFGKFGRQYYSELCRMEKQGKVKISAIVTRTGTATGLLANHIVYSETAYRKQVSIGQVDIFVVVVPPRNRSDIISFYSMLGNLLVEKPVCTSGCEVEEIIKAQSKTSFAIEVSQIFRFHPISKKLKEFLFEINSKVVKIEANFVNTLRNSWPDEQISNYLTAEMNHMLDLVFYLTDLNRDNLAISLSKQNLIEEVCINVGNNLIIRSKCGWFQNQDNIRTLSFLTNDSLLIECDFVRNTISYSTTSGFNKEYLPSPGSLIASQLDTFIQYCRSLDVANQDIQPDQNISQALQLISLLYPKASSQPPASVKKRIAVIGGGIFGSTIALRMAKNLDVDLYESSSEILTGATLNNQWRHHSGFHYPLSHETIKEIVDHKLLFEEHYSSCIRKDVLSYYFVSHWAQEISPKRYLAAMNLFGLNYDIVSCPQWVNPESVSLSLLTDEAVYDVDILREIIHRELFEMKVNVFTNHEVTCVDISPCEKTVYSNCGDNFSKQKHATYDFVVDCTNGLGCFDVIGLPTFNDKVRVELVELAELNVDIPKMCFTFIDAPFVSLTSMGKDGDFMLSHRDHSLHARHFVSGSEKKIALSQVPTLSSYPNLIGAAKEYIPGLSLATHKGSRYAWKGISPYSKEVWERPTVIRDHGFGFISVIAGKILTSVSNALEVEKIILGYF
jgi:predicted dehydrogenase